MAVRPILFNAPMVQAILNGKKTCTRRVIKLKYDNTIIGVLEDKKGRHIVEREKTKPLTQHRDGKQTHYLYAAEEKKPPYRLGDILYVRENFHIDYLSSIPGDGRTRYEADGIYKDFSYNPAKLDMMRRLQRKGICPSIHMPKELARIFLRVTAVRAERLQDITSTDVIREGTDMGAWYEYNADQHDFRACFGDDVPYEYETLKGFFGHTVWDRTLKTENDYMQYGWDANPWVWVICFERCDKPNAF